ncbi:MAG: LuxR C-terminal-related transcriptional regulator [Hyphomicrobiaceae bacterium]|jgi:DNA-binding NarL/FixJ family response regulator
MNAPARGKALIADDHGLYRTGLGFLLRDQLGFDEIVEVAGFDEALDQLAANREITLALFDLSMPGMGGPDSLVLVREAYPDLRVAVVSASEDRNDVLETLAAGLGGYVPKSLPDDEIVAALESVISGKVFVPRFMAQPMPGQRFAPPLAQAQPRPAKALRLEDLTPRQRDVLDGVLKGLSNKEIARSLDIAEGTVKIHLSALFSQLGARNRTDLATRSQLLFGGSLGR